MVGCRRRQVNESGAVGTVLNTVLPRPGDGSLAWLHGF